MDKSFNLGEGCGSQYKTASELFVYEKGVLVLVYLSVLVFVQF